MVRVLQSITKISSYSNVVVTGTKEVLMQQSKDSSSWLFQVLRENPAPASSAAAAAVQSSAALSPSLVQAIVERLSPGTDQGASSEFWYSTTDQRAVRVALCALPTAVSRHNIKARPHAITKFVKAHKEKTSTLVVILADIEDVYAAGSAVARASPRYSRKKGQSEGVPNLLGDDVQEDGLQLIFQHALNSELHALLQNTCHGIQLAARLVDAPPNELHTDAFVEEARRVATDLNTKITVIQGKDLDAQGFGGLYGVGKASLHPPALVVLSHFPVGSTETSEGAVVFAGKGIVYDTGGLSIKSKDGMPGMKRDMGGAAAVLGAFAAVVQSQAVSKPLHAVLCIAENAVSEVATRPDDIHTMFSGKTVEINNTDAEGRLVLGDGVAYAVQRLHPEVIIDIATLTGAQGVSTGKYFAALYCNNEELEAVAIRAGRVSGDLAHPMPYAPEFFRPEFKSSVADMKNSVKDRSNAQVSCAGQFIGNHLGDEFEKNGKWLHVDMASPAYCKADERATGFGVALLCSILQQLEKK